MIRTTISRGNQTFKVGDFPDGGEAFEEAEVKALSKGWMEGTYKASFEKI